MRRFDGPTWGSSASRAVLAWCLLSCLGPAPAQAAVAESEILSDSTLELVESATFGSYRSMTVTLSTRDGKSTLIARKDGAETTVAVPVTASLAVWRAVLDAGIESMAGMPPAEFSPDQSRFTVSFRAAGTTNTFMVYGVDDLPDPRCRSIVREILHLADARAFGKTWQK